MKKKNVARMIKTMFSFQIEKNIFFNHISFLSFEIKRITDLEQNRTMILSRSKQNSNITVQKMNQDKR